MSGLFSLDTSDVILPLMAMSLVKTRFNYTLSDRCYFTEQER